MNEYRIPAVNFPRLEEEIEKLNKRAKKLNVEPVKLTLLRSETVIRKDEVLGFEYHETFHYCTVEGETPRLAGWRLIAAVQPVGDECLVREVPGEACPSQYRHTDYHCDHCNTTRRRNAVFVLQNEDTQEYKQVGRNCIADFLGGASPEGLLGAAEYVFNFVKLAGEAQEEGWGWGGGGRRVVPLSQFVAVVALVNRRIGYVSRSQARDTMQQSTSDLAWELCTSPPTENLKKFIREKQLYIAEDDVDTAKEAVEWGAAITPEKASSTYLHDLGVCCRQEYVTWDRAGYVASVIQAYNFDLRKRTIREDHQSVHLGEVGKRQDFTLTVVSLHSTEGEWGARTRVTFTDPDGNVLIWWASGCPEWLKQGRTVRAGATVKRHTDYQGVKQTELTRVRPDLDTEEVGHEAQPSENRRED